MAYVHYFMLCITNNYVLALITMKTVHVDKNR